MFGQFFTLSSDSFFKCSFRRSSSFLGGGRVKLRRRSISLLEMHSGAAAFLRVVRIVAGVTGSPASTIGDFLTPRRRMGLRLGSRDGRDWAPRRLQRLELAGAH